MANNQFYGRDPFGNMDDIFNQLMGNMGGYNTENKRYLINGREVTPEEFAQYRQTYQVSFFRKDIHQLLQILYCKCYLYLY